MSEKIIIYTDGAARGNPGPGGYGVVMMYGKHRKELCGGFKHTTNNRMELMAVIKGLQLLKRTDIPVVIYSDSKYVVDAVTKGWLFNWIKTDFKGGKKNADLWRTYYNLSRKFNIEFVWVKGHAENVFNNRCDELATSAADQKDLPEDLGFSRMDMF